MIKEFETLIIGATFYGCGLAAAIPRATVIESACVVGADFALTFNSGCDWDCRLETLEAGAFRAELTRRRTLVNGRSNIAAFSPLLSKWCLERNLPVELSCEVIRISGNELDVINVEGVRRYRAGRIIDARPVPRKNKYLTAAIFSESPLNEMTCGPFVISPRSHGGVAYLSYELPSATDWPAARYQFMNDWLERPVELKTTELLLIGSRFDYRNYSNPAAALEAGLKAGAQ